MNSTNDAVRSSNPSDEHVYMYFVSNGNACGTTPPRNSFVNMEYGPIRSPLDLPNPAAGQMFTFLDVRTQNPILVMTISTMSIYQNRSISLLWGARANCSVVSIPMKIPKQRRNRRSHIFLRMITTMALSIWHVHQHRYIARHNGRKMQTCLILQFN